MTRIAARVVRRWLWKLADQASGQRKYVRDLSAPINPPKSIPKRLQREMGDAVAVGDETTRPDRRDIQPSDVFQSTTDNMGVLNLAETGKDFNEDPVERNKGYETVNNLSQYLIRTDGGGEGGPEGKQL